MLQAIICSLDSVLMAFVMLKIVFIQILGIDVGLRVFVCIPEKQKTIPCDGLSNWHNRFAAVPLIHAPLRNTVGKVMQYQQFILGNFLKSNANVIAGAIRFGMDVADGNRQIQSGSGAF